MTLPAPPPFPVPSGGALQGIVNETAAGLEDADADDESDEDDDGNLAAGRPQAGGGGNPIIISVAL